MDPEPFYNTFYLTPVSLFLLIPILDLGSLFLLAFLLIGLGLFTATQSAIFFINQADLESPAKKNSPAVKALIYLKNRQGQFSILILACNTAVTICICFLVNTLLQKWIPESVFINWGTSISQLFINDSTAGNTIAKAISFFLTVCCSTTLILLFREWMPKFFELADARKLSLFLSVPLKQLYWLFLPLTSTMVLLSKKTEALLRIHKLGLQSTTKEDLDAAIDLALTNEKGNEKQVNILRGIINFNDVTSKQVMTPRTEIYGIEMSLHYPDVLQTVKECGFSRLPVYEEDFDQITGILYAKDLIAHLHESEEFEWQNLIRKDVLFVPESKKINELLDDFREHHKHMAFVVDEYGGTNGLITLEDIMEEIVGEIKDEFDDQQNLNYIKLDPHNYLFEGKTLINDMCRILNLDVENFDEARGNADSIAGLFLEHSGEMPYKDQVLEIHHLRFTVNAVSKKRIEQIKVSL
ncbi:MAG: DUF21 domain-containing protein [Saprospiraceae bacterium]|nr:DUF21 domain-containing protein [Saprospiraceae bacterium]